MTTIGLSRGSSLMREGISAIGIALAHGIDAVASSSGSRTSSSMKSSPASCRRFSSPTEISALTGAGGAGSR